MKSYCYLPKDIQDLAMKNLAYELLDAWLEDKEDECACCSDEVNDRLFEALRSSSLGAPYYEKWAREKSSS